VAPRVGSLVGVDVSGVMVAKARERLADLPNVSFLEGDGWHLPLPDGAVDLVFSHIVFQHVPRPAVRSYLAESFRVLRPGGELVFLVPEEGPGTPDDPPDDDTFEMRFYSAVRLGAELRALGFDLVDELRQEVRTELHVFQQLRVRARKPESGAVRAASASPYERTAGFCRALRVGRRILVSGTAPIGDDGRPFAPGDPGAQMRRCLEVARCAVEELGGTLAQTVRTRMFLCRLGDWNAVQAVHGEVFSRVRPVATAVLVAGLLDPAWCVEVELEVDLDATPAEVPS
ncbi:MAG: methyltransferase domain-containing protein, partial [Planctomycetes bacterium]|nr:methyltransferase domain-containing protein [Planctomycetota bacterium]